MGNQQNKKSKSKKKQSAGRKANLAKALAARHAKNHIQADDTASSSSIHIPTQSPAPALAPVEEQRSRDDELVAARTEVAAQAEEIKRLKEENAKLKQESARLYELWQSAGGKEEQETKCP